MKVKLYLNIIISLTKLQKLKKQVTTNIILAFIKAKFTELTLRDTYEDLCLNQECSIKMQPTLFQKTAQMSGDDSCC